MWHAAFDQIQFGRVLWSRCCMARSSGAGSSSRQRATAVSPTRRGHGLPEGQRGIFVGGGGAQVRLPRLMGVAA
jgi:hypothetical protein